MQTFRKIALNRKRSITSAGVMVLLCVGATYVHAQSAATASPLQKGQSPPTQVMSGYAGQPEYTDPAGTYAGFTICADCSGISVRLLLTDAAGAQDHGTYRETMMYLDAPTHSRHGKTSRDQQSVEHGTWSMSPAMPKSRARQVCLTREPKPSGTQSDCYHLVHQTVLVYINGFETDHEPDPFPAGLKTLLKQRRLSDGREYPMLPVDDWTGFPVSSDVPAKAQ